MKKLLNFSFPISGIYGIFTKMNKSNLADFDLFEHCADIEWWQGPTFSSEGPDLAEHTLDNDPNWVGTGRQWSDISPGGEMVQRCNRRTSSCGAGGKYLTRGSAVAVARVTGARVIRRECRTLLSTRPPLIPLVQTLAHPLISQQDLCRVHTAHFRAQPSGHHGGTPWGWLRYSHSISKPSLFVSQIHIFHSFSSWANFYFEECHIPQQSENCVCICIELFSKLAFTSPSSIWVVSS